MGTGSAALTASMEARTRSSLDGIDLCFELLGFGKCQRPEMQGAAVFGMSLAYFGKITAKNGAIEQGNYDDYQMLRYPDAPKVNVEIVESTEKPTGVGEPGVPVIAPAIVNALFKLTGKRYYSLPLSDYGLV